LTPKEYSTQYQLYAKGLTAEGWSQTAIAKELRVDRTTVTKWLKNGHSQLETTSHYSADVTKSLSTKTHYHIANRLLEDFQPPQGLTFPLIIADPPWNVSDPGHLRERTARPKRPFTKDIGGWDHYEKDQAYLDATGAWLQRLFDVAADDAWLFFWCSYRYLSHILRQALAVGWAEHTFFVWHKTNPMPLFGNNNYLQSIEVALVLRKGAACFRFGKRGGQQPHNFVETPQVGGAERQKQVDGSAANLAQKPLALNRLWVAQASKPGDWVLDAFAGTGTATCAALGQGRNACAVEGDRVMAVFLEEKSVKPFYPEARPWP
jgi:DNA modification methylase